MGTKFLHKQYQIETNTPKEAIFAQIRQNIRKQKSGKEYFLFNYKHASIYENRVEVTGDITGARPFSTSGSITFDFIPTSDKTLITCTIVPYNKYAILMMSCLAFIFMVGISVILVTSLWYYPVKALAFLSLIWSIFILFPYLSLRITRKAMEEDSLTFLHDLGLIKGRET
ncbi:hypothetical protein [Desertivirga brevis]|uniref:hypothetical protein n=1 Tax=Desertivirga brevis TaxID=2810310 RepID=UPI001A95FC58|nr:hypothetical protein [Pedobacter sp. SYSU D00873]